MAPVMLWDFDGTLASRRQGWSATIAELARQAGHALSTEQVRPHLAGRFPWEQPADDHRAYAEPEAWWHRMTTGIAGAYRACGLSDPLARDLAGQFRHAYLDISQWQLFPDTIPALEALSGLGWIHVVCSNHVPELPALVESLGLRSHLARVVSSALVGWEKPNPVIYRAALAGLARPEQAWMVGDNYEADVAGPQKLGIRAILVRREHPSATHQCPDLLAVAETLCGLA